MDVAGRPRDRFLIAKCLPPCLIFLGMPKDVYDIQSGSRFESYIPGKGYDVSAPISTPDDVAIASEIAVRLLELRDVDRRKPMRLINKLSRLYRTSPALMWVALEILASNAQGGKSLSTIAEEHFFTKQAIHQDQQRELQILSDIMPELAYAISTILRRSVS